MTAVLMDSQYPALARTDQAEHEHMLGCMLSFISSRLVDENPFTLQKKLSWLLHPPSQVIRCISPVDLAHVYWT